MRIAVLCNDTRGGIQPYVALGLGLQRAGHEVWGVAPADFAPLFAEAGLPLRPLTEAGEVAQRGAASADRGTLAAMRYAVRAMPARLEVWTREALAACEDADVMTGGIGGMVMGTSVAEKLGRPFIETHLHPLGFETDAYPGVLTPWVPPWVGSWGVRLSHRVSAAALWTPFDRMFAPVREKVLGLSGRARVDPTLPVLYGFSRHVLSVPQDGDRPRHVTGYWTLPAGPEWRPPPALEAFLARGGPVVSVGFGSMGNSDPAAVTRLVLDAIRGAKVRAVLLAGWGGLRSLPDDDVFCADALPHDWLFARVAAVVHHGGAGTTGAALRAGVPAVVVPFAMDQPFWGARVAALGVGPAPIPRKRLTRERLEGALRRAIDDEATRARAAELGERIRAEDGVAAAVEHFERVAVPRRAA